MQRTKCMPSRDDHHTINVLDHGFVILKNDCFMGGDLQVVNSARISYDVQHARLEEGDDRLINFLMKNRHGTPFESSVFTFHVSAPIFVIREWHRHRIASYNEVSARYIEMPDKFYVPKGEYVREQVGKSGNYHFEAMPKGIADDIQAEIEASQRSARKIYEGLIKQGVAKEVARIVLPVSLYSEFYFTVNARSLMNFISLRSHHKALKEIQEYAKALEAMFALRMPITHECFNLNGRIAP